MIDLKPITVFAKNSMAGRVPKIPLSGTPENT